MSPLANRSRIGFARHPVYGFDSFRGLDEDWGRHGTKGMGRETERDRDLYISVGILGQTPRLKRNVSTVLRGGCRAVLHTLNNNICNCQVSKISQIRKQGTSSTLTLCQASPSILILLSELLFLPSWDMRRAFLIPSP